MGGVVGARGIYSIGAVSRMLGVSQPAIRSWEDRYGLIVAERSEGGRRVYTRDQLEQLRFVKERLDEGLSAADAHRLLAEREAGPPPITQRPTSNPSTRLLVLLADGDPYGAELNEFFLRTEGYEVEIASTAEDAEDKFASRDPALSVVELMISGGVGRSAPIGLDREGPARAQRTSAQERRRGRWLSASQAEMTVWTRSSAGGFRRTRST